MSIWKCQVCGAPVDPGRLVCSQKKCYLRYSTSIHRLRRRPPTAFMRETTIVEIEFEPKDPLTEENTAARE